MLKAAVVGLGWWGKELVGRLAGSDRINVTRGVEVNLDAVRDFAEATGLAITDSYDEVLASADIDAVILVTPHALHEEQVLAAAAAGKQIFCEKPLALSGGAAERMLSACDDTGLLLGIGHERRYEPAFEEMKRRVDAGEIGTLLHLEINASYNLFAGTSELGWRQDPKQAPAGTLTALGVHLTDYMQTVAGPVSEVHARTSHRSSDFPGDDILSVQLAFESGVTRLSVQHRDHALLPAHRRVRRPRLGRDAGGLERYRSRPGGDDVARHGSRDPHAHLQADRHRARQSP